MGALAVLGPLDITYELRYTVSMTRKHFIAVAKVLAATDGIHDYSTKAFIAHGLADEFATINPNFDRDRFLKACGVEA